VGIILRPVVPKFRSGSYALNDWLFLRDTWPLTPPSSLRVFGNESRIYLPTRTPLLGDGTSWFSVPTAADFPAEQLGDWVRDSHGAPNPFAPSEMSFLAIPRHGERPNAIPKRWPISQKLPGAINVSFFDGHSELVPLEQLWQLSWHRDYVPPAKRPGLK
jgi:prepilin-type processing-associated H-X9-DG protein